MPSIYWTISSPPHDLAAPPSTARALTRASSPAPATTVPTVAVDGAHIYWTNTSPHTIGRANLDGTASTSASSAAISPVGVAVDAAHVYWGTDLKRTRSGAPTSTARASAELHHPPTSGRGAVDHAHVYWANLGTGTIGRANLDGTGVDRASSRARIPPTGWRSTAPRSTGRTVGRATKVGRANLDGSGVDQSFITVKDDPTFGPVGVAVDNAHVYWTSTTSRSRARSGARTSTGRASTTTSSPVPRGRGGGGRRA